MRENMSQPIITKNNNFSTVCSFYWKLINDYKKMENQKQNQLGKKISDHQMTKFRAKANAKKKY